jgi:hypothetical protein
MKQSPELPQLVPLIKGGTNYGRQGRRSAAVGKKTDYGTAADDMKRKRRRYASYFKKNAPTAGACRGLKTFH